VQIYLYTFCIIFIVIVCNVFIFIVESGCKAQPLGPAPVPWKRALDPASLAFVLGRCADDAALYASYEPGEELTVFIGHRRLKDILEASFLPTPSTAMVSGPWLDGAQ
jgi:hypothetical protein